MATSPTTAPIDIPTAEGLPFKIQSKIIQLTAAAAAARFVVARARTAKSIPRETLPIFLQAEANSLEMWNH